MLQAGAHNVSVSVDGGGAFAGSSGDARVHFYNASLSAASPLGGPAGGGTRVTISGAGLAQHSIAYAACLLCCAALC